MSWVVLRENYIWHVNCFIGGKVKGKDNRTTFKGQRCGKWGDSFLILARFETHRA